MTPPVCAFRSDGELGGDGEAHADADALAVAMTVSLGRLPSRDDLRAFARHLADISKRMTELAERT